MHSSVGIRACSYILFLCFLRKGVPKLVTQHRSVGHKEADSPFRSVQRPGSRLWESHESVCLVFVFREVLLGCCSGHPKTEVLMECGWDSD